MNQPTSELVYTTAPNGYRRATLPGHRVAIEIDADDYRVDLLTLLAGGRVMDKSMTDLILHVEQTLDEAEDEEERLAQWNRKYDEAGRDPFLNVVLLDE